jgi:hypothetical protein
MQTCFKSTKERLRATARTIEALDIRRQETGDDSLGRAIEAFLVNRELRELEHLALHDGATWD